MHWAESAEDAPEDENGLLAIEDGSTEDEDSVRAIKMAQQMTATWRTVVTRTRIVWMGHSQIL